MIPPRRIAVATMVLLFAAAPQSGRADVFKCTDAAAKVEFRDRPCASGESTPKKNGDKGTETSAPTAATGPTRPEFAYMNLDGFGYEVVTIVDAVGAIDPAYRAGAPPEVKHVFFGEKPNTVDTVTCERKVGFWVSFPPDGVGSVIAGVCRSNAREIRQLVHRAKGQLAALDGQLPADRSAPALRAALLQWRKARPERFMEINRPDIYQSSR